MMGQREFTSKLYYQLSLECLVPQDHFLRQVARAIDFSFIYSLARPYYSHTGQPSVDPVVIFKALLIGYLYGVTSERRLMKEIQLNLAYRWFLGYDLDEAIPHHSVLSKARARFGPEVFEGFFQRSIEMCREAGLLGEGPVYADTTLVQAGASMDSVVERDEAINPPLSIEEYVRRLYAENEPLLREEEAPPPASSGKPASDAVLASGYNKPRADGERRKANREFVSRTDPEATVVSRQGFGLHLAYKAHLALAGTRGQVITAALATTGAKADEHLLAELLWHHRRLAKLPATEVVADAKYGTMANYSFLHRIGIVAFIPPREHPRGPGSTWGREHFTYFREEDVFLCPVGMRMKRFARRESTQRSSYRVERGACVGCRFRERCSPWGQDRTISRFFEQELVDAARERVSSPVGRRLLCQRKVRAEGVFGLAKELHGLRRTRFRGRWRVQIQLWLTAAAMNIKRATRELRRRGPRAQPARATLAAGYPSTVGLFVPALTSLLGGALLLRSYR